MNLFWLKSNLRKTHSWMNIEYENYHSRGSEFNNLVAWSSKFG
ncbi:hypothetical protein P678_0408 [Acinetobacter baumannii UH7807]|nr:hypothetical protein P641_1202 [Acinetobacter baumannii UH0807]ETP92345.1 hypothetical protein P645_1716 [Acinetobacter baumannii UH10707]ETP96045.1 hypothetical protein P643_0786 [Acinetobacter baumannii UH10007]ETQ34827.1 hypothetical protein P654_2416 [Acinetobacter baumannii UH16008]ETQ73851.1 hypothetical protein P664_0769 [Acinetobacter baumannii UH2707]ETQ76393.1 hypothetical protein P665_0074 [Acinetobacter baumannii UH2907]ETQ85111.1 hypothetical protein P670_0676 [Acinetobacter b